MKGLRFAFFAEVIRESAVDHGDLISEIEPEGSNEERSWAKKEGLFNF